MIDLHCHLLPDIDDGPRSPKESVDLGDAAFADGTRVLAATPHLRGDHPAVVPAELAQRCEELRRDFEAYCVPVEIVSGGEVDLGWAERASDEDLRLVTYGQRGTDLLLETPYGPLDQSFEFRVYERFAGTGIRLLLAHPERNPSFQRDPARLAELVRTGVLIQITAGSLVSASGRSRSRRLAEHLVREGLAHVIASDSHGPGRRAPRLSAAVDAAERLDPARALWMATEAPATILAGEPLDPPVSAPRRRGLLDRLTKW